MDCQPHSSGGGAIAGVTTVELTQKKPIGTALKGIWDQIEEAFKQSVAATTPAGSTDSSEFDFQKVSEFFKQVGEYVVSYAESTGEAIKKAYEFAYDWENSKEKVTTLYKQLEKWAIVLHREWGSVSQALEKIWDSRGDTFPELWKTMKDKWDVLNRIMSSINENIEGWFTIADLVIKEAGGWAEAGNFLAQSVSQWSSWLQTIGNDWTEIKDVLELLADESERIKEVKKELCGENDTYCKEIASKIFSKGWEPIKKEIQNWSSSQSNKRSYWQPIINGAITELKNNKDEWKKIIKEAQTKLDDIMKFFEKDGSTEKLKELFTQDKKEKLSKAWQLLSGNQQDTNGAGLQFKTSSNLQNVVMKELFSNFEENFPKLEGLIDLLSSAPLAGSSPVELTEEGVKGMFKVRPGNAQTVYAVLNDLGLPVSDSTLGADVAARAVSNLIGTFLNFGTGNLKTPAQAKPS